MAKAVRSGGVARAFRVAGGLARPSTRASYLARIRERRGDHHLPTADDESCAVCGAPGPRVGTYTSPKTPRRTFTFRLCDTCGHVGNPDNIRDYRQYKDASKLPMKPRVGTKDRIGRELHMAEMATEILGRSGLDV